MFSFFFSSRRRHTRCSRDWSSDVCSSDLVLRSWRRALASASGWLPAEKAFHHLLGSANPRCSYEHRGLRGHLLAVGLLSLGQSYRPLSPFGLDHGNALAVDGRYQNRTRTGRRWGCALDIEGVEVLGSLLKDFFDAAHGNRRTGDFRNALAGFPERSLHRCLDHALLQLIRERACWQLQSFIQRMDARGARPAVAHSLDLDGAKDGLQHASMQAPVGI